MAVPVGAGSKVGTFFSSFTRLGGGIISKSLSFMSSYFRLIFTILALTTVVVSGVTQSIEERSFAPFVLEVGGRILAADELLYQWVQRGEGFEVEIWQYEPKVDAPFGYNSAAWLGVKFRNFGAYMNLYWNIFVNIWIIYIVFKMFYKIFSGHNASETFWNGMFAVIIMVMLQMYFGQLIAINQIADGEVPISEVQKNKFVYGVPFKGVVTLVLNVDKLLSPTKSLVSKSLIVKPPDEGVYNIGGNVNVTNGTVG